MIQYPTAQELKAQATSNALEEHKDVIDRFYCEAQTAQGKEFVFHVSQWSDFPEEAKEFLRSQGFGIYWDSACLWFNCDFSGKT